MATLTRTHKFFVVQQLAMFKTPTEVAEAVKETFGLEIGRQQVYYYDPTRPGGPEKWRELYDETRARFLDRITDIPIANQAVRLRELNDAVQKAKQMGRSGNLPLLASLLKQAAEETGGRFTNHHVLEHAGELKTTTGVMPVPVASMAEWMQAARAQQEELERASDVATAEALPGTDG